MVLYVRGNWAIAEVREVEITKNVILRRFGQFDVGRGEGGNFVSYVRGNWAIAEVREVEVTKKVILRRLGQFDVGRGEGGFFCFVCPRQLGNCGSS